MPSDVMLSISTKINAILCIITNNCKLLQLLYRCSVFIKIAFHLTVRTGFIFSATRLGPASLHQKTKKHKPEAHGSVTICIWSAQEYSHLLSHS